MGGGDIDIGGGDIRCLLRRRRLIWDARAAVAYRAMFSMLSAVSMAGAAQDGVIVVIVVGGGGGGGGAKAEVERSSHRRHHRGCSREVVVVGVRSLGS